MREMFGLGTTARTTATDEAAVRDALSSVYALDIDSLSTGRVAFRNTLVASPKFAVGRLQFAGEVVGESSPLPFVCVVQVRAGHQTVTTQRRSHVRDDPTPFLFPIDSRKQLRWSDIDLQQILLRPAAIDFELTRLRLPPLHELRLRPDPEQVRRPLWDAAVDYARGVSASATLADSHLVQEAAFRALVAGFVEAFTTAATVSDGDGRRAVSGTPATVRRALDFIEEHAGEPLTVADIAHSARMSTRGLQATFIKHEGHSPMHALRLARMRRVRAELVSADPRSGVTVTAVAARWGFSNVGRFAQHYRETYGEAPSRTLGRS